MLKLARMTGGEPEIFRSVQGEGPMTGRVRTFVRLSGCNLHCVWCDTAYTWNWVGSPWPHVRDAPDAPHKFAPDAEMAKRSVDEVVAAVQALPAEGVVITGGEPLMQADGVLALARRLRALGLRVEIETNGSIAPSRELVEAVDLFVVSPKLAHASNDPAVALRAESLAAFAAAPNCVFKFVVREAADLEEIAALAALHAIAPQRIFVMAEGTDVETLDRRASTLIDAAIVAGYAYCDRLHIRLFGQQRGV